MATSHHSTVDDEQRALLKRFSDECDGIAKREWPDGRVSNEDDGSLSYALATDVRHRCIRMVFPKPVTWLGFDREAAEHLRDQLTERLLELRGINAT
jgi:hypothetical protein